MLLAAEPEEPRFHEAPRPEGVFWITQGNCAVPCLWSCAGLAWPLSGRRRHRADRWAEKFGDGAISGTTSPDAGKLHAPECRPGRPVRIRKTHQQGVEDGRHGMKIAPEPPARSL